MTDSREKGKDPKEPEGTKGPERGSPQGSPQGKGGFGQHAERYRERWAASHPGAPKRPDAPDAAAPADPTANAPDADADAALPDDESGPGDAGRQPS